MICTPPLLNYHDQNRVVVTIHTDPSFRMTDWNLDMSRVSLPLQLFEPFAIGRCSTRQARVSYSTDTNLTTLNPDHKLRPAVQYAQGEEDEHGHHTGTLLAQVEL